MVALAAMNVVLMGGPKDGQAIGMRTKHNLPPETITIRIQSQPGPRQHIAQHLYRCTYFDIKRQIHVYQYEGVEVRKP